MDYMTSKLCIRRLLNAAAVLLTRSCFTDTGDQDEAMKFASEGTSISIS